MGRGAGDYADTAIALKKAARTKEATEATARATFIQDRLKRKAKIINLVQNEFKSSSIFAVDQNP